MNIFGAQVCRSLHVALGKYKSSSRRVVVSELGSTSISSLKSVISSIGISSYTAVENSGPGAVDIFEIYFCCRVWENLKAHGYIIWYRCTVAIVVCADGETKIQANP